MKACFLFLLFISLMNTFAIVVVDNSTATIEMDMTAEIYEFEDFEEPDELSEFYDELEEEPL